MAELRDMMAYVIQNYPPNLADELSNARLTKMVYLADWHQALNHGHQISNIAWYFDNFGPFVRDVEQTAAENDDIFIINLGSNMYGRPKKTVSLRDSKYEPSLSQIERESIDHVISVTKSLYWAPFIRLVYSTHPIASSERYSYLNLVEKANEYRNNAQSTE